MYMGRFIKFMACASMSALLATPALAFRSGPPAGFNGSTASFGSSCMQCHGAGAGPGSVQILGFPASYLPSTNYDLTVRIADATKLGAGFQLSVEDASGEHTGVLSLLDATNTQFNTGNVWVNHTASGVNNSVTNWATNGNAANFMVRWTSPATDEGPVTAWAAGNAINNNLGSSGDTIYLTSTTANFMEMVPTVSQWGLAILAMLVLTAGSLMIGRRRPVSVRNR